MQKQQLLKRGPVKRIAIVMDDVEDITMSWYLKNVWILIMTMYYNRSTPKIYRPVTGLCVVVQ